MNINFQYFNCVFLCKNLWLRTYDIYKLFNCYLNNFNDHDWGFRFSDAYKYCSYIQYGKMLLLHTVRIKYRKLYQYFNISIKSEPFLSYYVSFHINLNDAHVYFVYLFILWIYLFDELLSGNLTYLQLNYQNVNHR